MSVLKLARRIVILLAIVAVGSSASGQVYHPFAEPLEFDPDWQYFAPVDADSLLETTTKKRANMGWFATYDRTYLRMSRSDTEPSGTLGDFTWGNRFDLGLMNQKESGWLFTLRSITGPNVYDRVMRERINRTNAADTNNPLTPIFPVADRNDPQLRQRVYVLGDSLNVAGLSSAEINKTWRMEPYRYGGILEPMLGMRYGRFKDYAVDQAYGRDNAIISGTGAPPATFNVEHLQTLESHNDNYLVGGQLGFRYFNYYKRWTLSSELRALALQNFYNTRDTTSTITTEYSGNTTGATTVATDNTTGRLVTDGHGTAFVPGFEVRAEAAYQVTKYMCIRGGFEMIDFAKGIKRGSVDTPSVILANNPNAFTNVLQSVQMMGVTFGLTLNR